ncbi:MAG: cupin domain-containing protein [Bacteroidota bacterium]
MPQFIKKPTQIKAEGNLPKIIEEFIGRVNSETTEVSIAQMKSPPGWKEPGQTPEFNEYTLVLRGILQVTTIGGDIDVHPGEAIIVHKGEWVQYSSPHPEGAEYIAVCLPGFSPQMVHRDQISKS